MGSMPGALDEGPVAVPGWVGHNAAAGLQAELTKVKLAVQAFLFGDSKASADSKLHGELQEARVQQTSCPLGRRQVLERLPSPPGIPATILFFMGLFWELCLSQFTSSW